MLRHILRAALRKPQTNPPWNPKSNSLVPPISSSFNHNHFCYFSSNSPKSNLGKAKKTDQKSKKKSTDESAADLSAAGGEVDAAAFDGRASRVRQLVEDEKDPSLDVGPNGRPLFTSTSSLSQLTRKDTFSYVKFRFLSWLLM